MTIFKHRPILPVAIAAIIGLALPACGGDSGDNSPTTTSETETGSASSTAPAAVAADSDAAPAALIIAQGGLGDQAYNDLSKTGLDRAAAATGIEATPVEAEDIVVEGQQVVGRAIDAGFGLIIDLEFSHSEFLPTLAAENPDTKFAFLNLELDAPNLMSIVFQEHEGSYLAGALAARMTTVEGNDKINPEKTIGVIGGAQSPGIDKFLVGFVQGANDVDPEVEVLVNYTNDFADPSLGKDAALAMYDQGADIIFQVTGGAGLGVIQAAEERNRYAIGVDTNQDDIAPGNVLTSMIKRSDRAVEEAVESYAKGEFPGGETVTLGLAEGGVELTEFEHTRDAIPDAVIEEIDTLRQQIIAGEIEVWNVIEDGYPDFFEAG